MAAKMLLPSVWDVPTAFRFRLGDTVGKQRLMQADGHLLLVLHKPPGADETQRTGRYFWRKPDGAWQAAEPGGKSITLGSHIAEYSQRLDALDKLEDEAVTATQYFSLMSAVGPIQRATRNLHKVLQEAREAAPEDRELINYRDRAYELERTADLLYQDAKNGLEFAVARQAEVQAAAGHRMAVSAHRLNLLAAFFFPLATLSAVLGVNIRHGWENHTSTAYFWMMVGVGLGAGALLAGYIALTGDGRK